MKLFRANNMKLFRKAEIAIRAKYNLKGARLNFNPQYHNGKIALFEAWHTVDVIKRPDVARKFELTTAELKTVND